MGRLCRLHQVDAGDEDKKTALHEFSPKKYLIYSSAFPPFAESKASFIYLNCDSLKNVPVHGACLLIDFTFKNVPVHGTCLLIDFTIRILCIYTECDIYITRQPFLFLFASQLPAQRMLIEQFFYLYNTEKV